MEEKTQYLKWIALFCVVLAVFALAVMAVGYQPFSFGHVATVVVLVIAAAITGYFGLRKDGDK